MTCGGVEGNTSLAPIMLYWKSTLPCSRTRLVDAVVCYRKTTDVAKRDNGRRKTPQRSRIGRRDVSSRVQA